MTRQAGRRSGGISPGQGEVRGGAAGDVIGMTIPDVVVDVDQTTSDLLTALALGDARVLGEAAGLREELRADSSLDPKTFALVKIAALVALDAAPASYLWQVKAAVDAGATAREILGVLTAIVPQTGLPRVVAAAPEIMIALGLELPGSPAV
jgi:4-carboxymuconolactone decarboxylase